MSTNLSIMFAEFNRLRSAGLEIGRLKRALGYAQSKQEAVRMKMVEYGSTMFLCRCWDHRRNPHDVCKHMTARRLQMGNRNYVLIWFWGKTYDPDTLLINDDQIFAKVTGIIDGTITTASQQSPDMRPARMSNWEVFQTINNPEMGFNHVWTALIGQRNDRRGWYGKYEMAFAREEIQK